MIRPVLDGFLWLQGWVVRLVPIIILAIVLFVAYIIFFAPKTTPEVDGGTITIVGKGVKIDANKFRVDRNTRGDVHLPIVDGTLTAGRDIRAGEKIPLQIDLTGASSKGRDSGWLFITGIDSRGYYNGIERILWQPWILNLGIGVGYGFGSDSIFGAVFVGVPILSEHSDVVIGYTTNQSVTAGLSFKF